MRDEVAWARQYTSGSQVCIRRYTQYGRQGLEGASLRSIILRKNHVSRVDHLSAIQFLSKSLAGSHTVYLCLKLFTASLRI